MTQTKTKRKIEHKGSLLNKLLVLLLLVCVAVRIALAVCNLCGWSTHWLCYIELPASVPTLMVKPWTLITYQVLHTNFIHLLFNLLALYYMGRLFLRFFSIRKLPIAFVCGGLVGAVCYIAAYNLIPKLSPLVAQAQLCGASACILCLLFAACGYAPRYSLHLPLIGQVRILTISFIFLFLDLLTAASVQAGGTFAHLGGILAGVCLGWFWRTQPQLPEQPDLSYLMQKIRQSGYNSLNESEKQALFRFGKK